MENPKLNFAHICDYAFNGEGGKPCIIGIFKNISIRNPEQPHPQMFIVTNITVETGKDYKQIIKLVKEDKQENDIIPPLVLPFGIGKEGGKKYAEIGLIGQINNIKFRESGKYLFKVYLDDTLLIEVPINVVVNNFSLIQG